MSEKREKAKSAREDLKEAKRRAKSATEKLGDIGDREGARKAGEVKRAADDAFEHVDGHLDPQKKG